MGILARRQCRFPHLWSPEAPVLLPLSLSEKEPGYCVLAGITSNALPAPEMFWGNGKSSGDMVLHQLCDSRGPSPHLLQVPS